MNDNSAIASTNRIHTILNDANAYLPAYDKDIDDERLTNAAVGITGVLSGVSGRLAISYLL